jgi:glycosyltransferase involved in cell wall biosynthesis
MIEKNLFLLKPPTLFFRNKILFYLSNFASICSYVQKAINLYQFDVIISTNFLFSPLIIQLANKNKIPFIFDLVDFQPYHINYIKFLPKIIKKFGILILRYLLDYDISHSSHVITTGLPLYYYAKNKVSDNLSIIPNGVDLQLFNPTKKQKENKITAHKSPSLCYIGALEYWVDYEYLFDSLTMLKKDSPEIKLYLIGPSRHLGLNRIKKMAKKARISENIILTGSVPYERLPSYIRSQTVCIVPFKKNYLTHCIIPMKIFEYLACGCPVISIRLAGIKSIFKDMIFYADTPEEFKEIFLKINSNRNDYINNEYKKTIPLLKNYSWVNLSEKYLEIIKKVISKFQ